MFLTLRFLFVFSFSFAASSSSNFIYYVKQYFSRVKNNLKNVTCSPATSPQLCPPSRSPPVPLCRWAHLVRLLRKVEAPGVMALCRLSAWLGQAWVAGAGQWASLPLLAEDNPMTAKSGRETPTGTCHCFCGSVAVSPTEGSVLPCTSSQVRVHDMAGCSVAVPF